MNGADDLNKILIRFLAPRDVENTALLTWEAQGRQRRPVALPAGDAEGQAHRRRPKKNRFMGTDFTYEDLRPENPGGAHVHRGRERRPIDGQDCW